jgi:hypothetical protein
MPTPHSLLQQFPDLTELFVRGGRMSFPIATKQQFVEQLVATGDRIVFQGRTYDTRAGAESMPDFFFPLESIDDLFVKAVELIVSRGLLPFPNSGHRDGGTT